MQQTVREIIYKLTRKHPLPNCCQKCDENYNQALSSLQELIKAVLEENEMQDHMAYKAELKDALCKLFK